MAAGGVYFAGASANRPGDGDNVLRPVILKYHTDLTRQWKQRYNDVAGQLFAITESGGALYAVGYAMDGGTQQYLVQKYDLNGVRIWNRIMGGGGSDLFNDVIFVGGRLFAVGKSNSPGHNGYDGTIAEFDPATGNPLAGNSFGGPLDQQLNGVTTDGTESVRRRRDTLCFRGQRSVPGALLAGGSADHDDDRERFAESVDLRWQRHLHGDGDGREHSGHAGHGDV